MPDRLYFTDSDEANELIAIDPMALLIGFALDQQVPVQKAFFGPLAIRERVGTLDAADTAALRANLAGLPGFGEMKIKPLGAVLAKRFGVEAAQGLVPGHPTLGDVDSTQALHEYQAAKRAHKAEWMKTKAGAGSG
jgi:hypothetical protein